MQTHVILGGGGSGKRMHSPINKSFILLRGKPIIAYSLQLFQEMEEINDIIVVMHKDWIPNLMEVINRYRITKVKQVVEGGKERQDSVRLGLDAVKQFSPKENDIILVHNAVNPLLTKETVIECIRAAQLHRAAAVGYQIKDTIKRVEENGSIIETLKRSELWGMQTPQCIEYALFAEAHARAFKEGFYGTDDIQLVERVGVKPVVVDCGYENIKMTTPEDISIAEKILEKREQNEKN